MRIDSDENERASEAAPAHHNVDRRGPMQVLERLEGLASLRNDVEPENVGGCNQQHERPRNFARQNKTRERKNQEQENRSERQGYRQRAPPISCEGRRL